MGDFEKELANRDESTTNKQNVTTSEAQFELNVNGMKEEIAKVNLNMSAFWEILVL